MANEMLLKLATVLNTMETNRNRRPFSFLIHRGDEQGTDPGSLSCCTQSIARAPRLHHRGGNLLLSEGACAHSFGKSRDRMEIRGWCLLLQVPQGNAEAEPSCKCPFQPSLIGYGLSIRHFMKTLRSVPAALLHGQTGDDLSHRLRRDGPPSCHNQPSSITTFSMDTEGLECS